VGGQGTLTATTLLARAALSAGLSVTSGEIHGMAQRGGVVESTLLIGYKSPKIGPGEADILLGFEPLETLRALPYLKPGGLVLSSTEYLAPLSVACGREDNPDIETIKAQGLRARSLPALPQPGAQGRRVQSGNIALLGAVPGAPALWQ
jgi:indolepyruvate ferredoxin oxidoreductase beta subunit